MQRPLKTYHRTILNLSESTIENIVTKGKMPIMSNFSFCQTVFKCRRIQKGQTVSVYLIFYSLRFSQQEQHVSRPTRKTTLWTLRKYRPGSA